MTNIDAEARKQGSGWVLAGRILVWSGAALAVIGALWAVTYYLTQGQAPLADAGPSNVVVGVVMVVVGVVALAFGVIVRVVARGR